MPETEWERMRRADKPLLTFVVDSREQTPYQFTRPKRREFEDGGTIRMGLGEGDYSVMLDGELLSVRIERKTMVDFFAVVGRGRERFERELERLKPYSSWLIIEAVADEIRRGCQRSLVSGEAAFASAICWAVKYNVAPLFCGSRRTGEQICQRILEEFAAHS